MSSSSSTTSGEPALSTSSQAFYERLALNSRPENIELVDTTRLHTF